MLNQSAPLGFRGFMRILLKGIYSSGCSLARFLRRFYLPPGCEIDRASDLSGSDRPFPCLPPFTISSLGDGKGLKSRRRSRFKRQRPRRILANMYAGAMSWLALGSPSYPPERFGEKGAGGKEGAASGSASNIRRGGVPFTEARLRPETVDAMLFFWEEVRAFDCGSFFQGLSGGRTALIPLLEEVEIATS